MPGVYAKPPKRVDFYRELKFFVKELNLKVELAKHNVGQDTSWEQSENDKDRNENHVIREDSKCHELEWNQSLKDEKNSQKPQINQNTWKNIMKNDVEFIIEQLENELYTAENEVTSELNNVNEDRDSHSNAHLRGSNTIQTDASNDEYVRKKDLERKRKQKDVYEVFFESGCHAIFCHVLSLRRKNLLIGDVTPILEVYEKMLLTEIETYDEDMGEVSMLIYFLSQRHHYYVDIHWQHHEMTYMSLFLNSLLDVVETWNQQQKQMEISEDFTVHCKNKSLNLCCDNDCTNNEELGSLVECFNNRIDDCNFYPFSRNINEKDCYMVRTDTDGNSDKNGNAMENNRLPLSTLLQAINLLFSSLFPFPPQRVVSSMAKVFTKERCGRLFNALEQIPIWWKSSRGRMQLTQLISGIAFFGLGMKIAENAIPASLLWACACNATKDIRCACEFCELQRRLLKICKRRDEIGVASAGKIKREIVTNMIDGGLPRLLFLLFSSFSKKHTKDSKKTEPSPADDNFEACDQSEEFASNNSETDAIERDYTGGHTSSNFENDNRSSNQCERIGKIGPAQEQNCDFLVNSAYDDQAMQYLSWVLLLTSWSYEQRSYDSILTYDNHSLLSAILACFDLRHARLLIDLETESVSPGIYSLLSVLLYLLLHPHLAASSSSTPYRHSTLLSSSFPSLLTLTKYLSSKIIKRREMQKKMHCFQSSLPLSSISSLSSSTQSYAQWPKTQPSACDSNPCSSLYLYMNITPVLLGLFEVLFLCLEPSGQSNSSSLLSLSTESTPSLQNPLLLVSSLPTASISSSSSPSSSSQSLFKNYVKYGKSDIFEKKIAETKREKEEEIIPLGFHTAESLWEFYDLFWPIAREEMKNSRQDISLRSSSSSTYKTSMLASFLPFPSSSETDSNMGPFKSFFFSISTFLAIISGIIHFKNVKKLRWRFYRLGPKSSFYVGSLSLICRRVIEAQSRHWRDDRCIFIKNMTTFVISRAEFLSALSLKCPSSPATSPLPVSSSTSSPLLTPEISSSFEKSLSPIVSSSSDNFLEYASPRCIQHSK